MRRFFGILAFVILCCFVFPDGAERTVLAKEQAFVVEARMLPSGKASYDIQLTVENLGDDWEGTVRVRISGSYVLYDCAYDTALSLPQGSTKQFVVRVPKDSIDRTDGTVTVILLDRKSKEAFRQEFRQLLLDEVDALLLGILSDDYPALTYLDAGGEELYYGNDDYPIKLEQLNQDNLTDLLDALTFLVIDKYHTDVLTDEQLKEIALWTDDGGVLIIGTGSYAEDTLAGFGSLGVQCREISEPGENVHYENDYVDLTKLKLAELMFTGGQYQEDYASSALICAMGDGAVGILPYSLSEIGRFDVSVYEEINYGPEYLVMRILDGVSNMAGARWNKNSSGYDHSYLFYRLMKIMGNADNRLNFGILKGLIVIYVVFVGPGLYLILRMLKKRELYWVLVPASAFVGILLVFWIGRGFEVVGTRVYSVTVEDLSDRGTSRTFLHCYDASHKEWSLRLADRYEYAGPLEDDNYTYGDDDAYYYHIRKEGDRLFFGIHPTASFEDSYFRADSTGNRESVNGSIVSSIIQGKGTGVDIEGTVTNDTDRDFVCFAVVAENIVHVYKSLPSGETCTLSSTADETIYIGSMDYRYSSFLSDMYQNREMETDALIALGVGIFSAYSRGQIDEDTIAVVGVTADWDKAVDDNCREVSYGCLYEIQ